MVLVPFPEPESPVVAVIVILLFTLLSNVPVNAPIVSACSVMVPPKFSVTVPPPELASSVTVSPDPGTD